MEQGGGYISSSRWAIVMVFGLLLGACDFDTSGLPGPLPPSSPDIMSGGVGFTAPGILQVYYGRDCANAKKQEQFGKTFYRDMSIRHDHVLPSFANRAAVFLNGWEFDFKGEDRDLETIAAGLESIKLAAGTLSWVARGFIAERAFDVAFGFCYSYAVVSWNDTKVDLASDQSAWHETKQDNNGDHTSLTANGGFAPTPAAVGKKTVALLPAGFLFSFSGADHHLLQLAYDLGPHARYLSRRDESFPYHSVNCGVASGKFTCNKLSLPAVLAKSSRADQGHVSWISSGILRDNDIRPYSFGDRVTVLTGNDVSLIEPPFAIVPYSPKGYFDACMRNVSTEETVDVEILDLPFKYAVPMLTGWELRYACDDEEVKRIGVYIHDVTYNAPGTAPGTLRYKVTGRLHDENSDTEFTLRHKVHILGLNFGPD